MKFLYFSVLLLASFGTFSESRSVKYATITLRGGKIIKADLLRGNGDEENAKEKKDIFEINKDGNLIDGDILPPKDRNTLVDEAKHWPANDIPVSYDVGLSLEAIGSIEFARVEYELRTCLSFVDRTNEKSYIEFDTLSGCYSSVGMVGGAQTISIGNGCERIGTVEHEMMHAIGIYHEQSRTDRDNYVTIMLENVDPGKEHNFNTYSYDVVDDRRVSYDFNSVMHYSDTSFSVNGEPTIVTTDPAFQDVIGQRRAFSPGDVTKINRMYNCADTRRVSSTCNFDDEAVCGYIQDLTDEDDWFRQQSSANSGNLPTTDGTSDVAGQGSYMLFGSPNRVGEVSGSMYSMRMKSKATSQCLQFSYTMKISQNSGSKIDVFVATIDSVTGEILSKGNPVTSITGNQDYDWNVERVTISAPSEYKLVIAATSESETDVIAVDDVSVLDKPCETGYFLIRDYTALVEASVPGDYIYGPLMYTDDGYAYQIKVYPVGTTSSSDGYMALYYAVAAGVNDDSLQWPMDNRFIRLAVVDQGPDALTRMSQSNNLMSSSSSSAWEKPTSTRNGAYGYSSFMTVSDVLNTHDFVKHDTLMISVEVKDMSSYASGKSTKYAVKTGYMEDPVPTDEEQMPESEPTEKEEGYSPEAAMMIAAISAASMFILMVIAMYIVNENNSKRITKLMIR